VSDCHVIRVCGRAPGHRGHHGGFRSVDRSTVLTPRQREVFRLLALGQTWDQITSSLGITYHTLANLRSEAVSRVGASGTMDVLRDIGWLQVPA
jgi:DNA-binding CsgD family transcriptional regulator